MTQAGALPEDDVRDAILRELLEAEGRGEQGDLQALRTRYPEHPQLVDEVWKGLQDYRRLRSELRQTAPGRLLGRGDRLGDFEVESVLAQGGMAVVYRARQLSLDGRLVALKVLPAELQTDRNRRRFRQEARLLSELHHARLAEVFGFGEEGDRVYYAMRLVHGCTLFDALQELASGARADVPLRRAVLWVADVAEALAVVHAAGLVHRDIKPANIMLEGDGVHLDESRAVLVDFGLVRFLDDELNAVTLAGSMTPGYAAPEQLLGRDVDARADVFSLGVTLHDLLARREPHQRSRASAGLEPLIALRPEVGDDLSALVGKAADPDPEWRYTDAGALHADLTAWLEGREVSARRPGVWERIRRWVRHNPVRFVRRTMVALVALALLGFAVVLGAGYVQTAQRLRAAHGRHDLEQLALLAGQVPDLLRSWFIADASVERTLDQLVGAAAGEAGRCLLETVQLLDQGQTVPAYLETFSYLRRTGAAADAFVRGYALSLLNVNAAHSDRPAGDLRSAALGLTARLFYERPDASPEDSELSEPFRVVLRRVLDHPGEVEADVLHALTALSGCGTAEDASRLVEFGLSHAEGSEPQRLSLACAERIVRRLNRRGELGSLPVARLLDRLTVFGQRMLGAGPQLDKSRHAHRSLFVALLLADRRLGRRPELEPFLPEGWRESLRAGQPVEGFPGEWAPTLGLLLAACGDDRLGRWWRVTANLEEPEMSVVGLARLCSLAQDPEFEARARQSLEGWIDLAPGRDEWNAVFDEALRDTAGEPRGQRDAFILDEDTWMGAETVPGALLELQVTSDELDPETRWSLRSATPSLSSEARSITLFQAEHRRTDSRNCLLLSHPGASVVRFVFELEVSSELREFEIHHLAATRTYYPHHGAARLTIRLDGEPLQSGRLVTERNPHPSPIELPQDRATAGRHELTIELDPTSTTTYRIFDLRLLARDR